MCCKNENSLQIFLKRYVACINFLSDISGLKIAAKKLFRVTSPKFEKVAGQNSGMDSKIYAP